MSNLKDLYFFHNPENSTIKIGISDNPEKRLKTIRYQGGISQTYIFMVFKNYGILEKTLHKLFKYYNYIGEWFSFEGVIKSYLEHVKDTKRFEEQEFIKAALLMNKYPRNTAPNLNWKKLVKLIDTEIRDINEIEDKIYTELLNENRLNKTNFIYSELNLWQLIVDTSVCARKSDIISFKSSENYFGLDFNNGKYTLSDW